MAEFVYFRQFSSPIGKLLLTSDGHALTGLHMSSLAEASAPRPGVTWKQDDGVFIRVCEQLESYFEGESAGFDLHLELEGTPFQRRV